MYVRQCGYEIVAGREDQATELCRQLVQSLGELGLTAHVVAGKRQGSRVVVVEEHLNPRSMLECQRALECDENVRAALCAWAAEFYPLVQAAMPAVMLRERLAA